MRGRPPGFTLAVEDSAAGVRQVRLGGVVTLADGGPLWRELRRALARRTSAEIDVAEVHRLDGGAAALLQSLAAAAAGDGRSVTFRNANGDVRRILELYACGGDGCERGAPRHPSVFAELGDFVVAMLASTRAILGFVGDLTAGGARALWRPRTVHLAEIGSLMERAGADGLPIVAVINFLVGAILGLQGAIQLHRFGADAFLANLVGLSVVRELGPLMTAILVAGRTGAAYAAELGTMTVNEEVDALRTLGLDPQRFLVFPRVLALFVVVPMLTALGDVVGCLGGLVIATVHLDQPAVVYLQALQRAVSLGDVGTGVLKSLFFAIAIGLIACQRGLATRGGAAGVGRSTTSAVVVVVFTLVALDAIFTWVFSLLDW